jgi:hypothetical protein
MLHHHWKQRHIASLFQITVRTIRKRLQSAMGICVIDFSRRDSALAG